MTLEMKYEDRKRLVELLTINAASARNDPKAYFSTLIKEANLPQPFKNQIVGGWSGDPHVDAVNLVTWAEAREVNPKDRRYTTLGSILEPELPRYGMGEASTLVSLIFVYRLIRDDRLLDRLAMRYQVPRQVEAKPQVADLGPDIDWKGSEEPADLQGLFRPDPAFLDVGFLKRGIERTTSVCRIEIEGVGKRGTGVLIDSDLVLTNYHVLGDNDDAVRAAASRIVLRFGVFTKTDGDESKGEVVPLDPKEPLVALSPTEMHDFILLRAGEGIYQSVDVAPVQVVVSRPARGTGLNILQHPEGKPMMVALSSSGVTSLLEDRGLIQYVSRTAGGSSGSPCFDDDWNMVALHHAARSKLWGVAGEGILMSAIYPEVRSYLSNGAQ